MDQENTKNDLSHSAQIAPSGDEQRTDEVYPSGGKLMILTFGLCMAIFVVALDNTIIATAIPTITTTFNSLNDVGWYGSSYLLTMTSLQPSFGKIYTHFNVKWVYICGLSIFEVGSIICAVSQSSVVLIIGRAIAGAGAAALFSGGMTIVGYTVPLPKRPLYIACLASMFGLASVVGPILGGVLTDKLSWRWCFWINLPFGGIAFITVIVFFSEPVRRSTVLTTKEKVMSLDLCGAGFLISAVVCLLLALQWGGTMYPWQNSRIIGLFVGFFLLVIIFICIQVKSSDHATISVRIFKQRSVLAASIFSCLLGMGLYTHIYYLPFYFQAVKGTTAEGSGIRTIPYLTSIALSSVVVGGSIVALGFYTPLMIIGSAIFTVGSSMLYLLRINSSAGQWIGYQILAGAGAGAGNQIPFLAVQTVLEPGDMPTGNALIMFFISLGGAISISVAQNTFSNTLIKEIPKFSTGIDAHTILDIGATHVRDVVPPSQLHGVLLAYTVAINTAFILPIVVGTLSVVAASMMEWRSVKGSMTAGFT